MSIFKYIFALFVMIVTTNAFALGTCATGLKVSRIDTYHYQGSINNGDGNGRFDITLSNGTVYSAGDSCNLNDQCGQANLSLLLAAFSAGYKVNLYGTSDGCTIFYGVGISY